MVDNVLVGSSSNMCYNMRWCSAEKKSFWPEIAATNWIIIKLHRYCIWWTCRIRLMTCSGYLQTPNKWWCLICIINAICCYCICTHWFTYLVKTIEFIVVKTPVKLQGSRYGQIDVGSLVSLVTFGLCFTQHKHLQWSLVNDYGYNMVAIMDP